MSPVEIYGQHIAQAYFITISTWTFLSLNHKYKSIVLETCYLYHTWTVYCVGTVTWNTWPIRYNRRQEAGRPASTAKVMLRSQTWLIFKLDWGSIGGSISSASGMGNFVCIIYIPCPTSIEGGTFFIDYFTVALLLVYYILCTSASHFFTTEVKYKSPRAMCLDLCWIASSANSPSLTSPLKTINAPLYRPLLLRFAIPSIQGV